MNDTVLFDYPIDMDNETVIISNIIQDIENRNYFVRQENWRLFRQKEYQTIAWSILELSTEGLEINFNAIMLRSKTSPIRFYVPFEFLTSLTLNFPKIPFDNFRAHVEKLVSDNVKSGILEKTSSLYSICTNPVKKLSDIEEYLKYLQSIVEKGYSSSKLEFKGMGELIPSYVAERKLVKEKYTTGFSQLDDLLTEGFAPKQITTIAALSGMGKSSFLLSSMKNLSNKRIVTAQFALEMNSTPLIHKLLAFKSGISVNKIVANPDLLSPREKEFYDAELERLRNDTFIYFNDRPNQSVKTIREQVMLLQDYLKTEYIVVAIDLFGKIRELQSSDNFARDYEKVTNIIQPMTKELGIHTILVAQIRRDVANRRFSRPTMNDLKNAGALTEVSDIVLGIHRPYYNPELSIKTKLKESIASHDNLFMEEESNNAQFIQEDMNKNIAEVIILKQRMGENNTLVNFVFNPETTCFETITAEYQRTINMNKTDLLTGA
jgi:replicative DNA helicase